MKFPNQFDTLLVTTLGKLKETVEIESVRLDGDISYCRDEDGIYHDPERSLDEIIIG